MRDWAKANGVDIDKAGTQFSQGWLAMELMVEGIRRTIKDGKEVTGENIKAAYETFKDYDTGGRSAPLTFTVNEHRGNRSLRLFQVKERIDTLDAAAIVRRGVFQVMEGRRVFKHLTVEENLRAGGYTRPDSQQVTSDLY